MMDCFGYCRVSTEEQVDGVSLDAQRAKITGYADLHDHALLDVHMDEGVSGKSMANRPALLKVLDLVCESGGLLIIYSISRLGRNTRDLIEMTDRMAKSGAQLASITEHFDTTTASGKMFFKLMAVLAEFERDAIIERTVSAQDVKRKRSEAIGNIPYGFQRIDETKGGVPGKVYNRDDLEVCSSEIEGLKMILVNMDTGYADIARKLGDAGHKSRSGKPWDRGVIRRIVQFHKSDKGVEFRTRNHI